MSRLYAAKMTEDELQAAVRRMCTDLGLAVQHIHDPRRSWLPGWPDLTIIGTDILFAELKSQHGTLSPEQRRVSRIIKAAGGRWVLWRPMDLLSGEIARTLTALAAAQPALEGIPA